MTQIRPNFLAKTTVPFLTLTTLALGCSSGSSNKSVDEDPDAGFGTLAMALGYEDDGAIYRFIGTIHVNQQEAPGDTVATIESGTGSQLVHIVPLLPGDYELGIEEPYSCVPPTGSVGYMGCELIEGQSDLDFTIAAGLTQLVTLTFRFRFQDEDIIVPFRVGFMRLEMDSVPVTYCDEDLGAGLECTGVTSVCAHLDDASQQACYEPCAYTYDGNAPVASDCTTPYTVCMPVVNEEYFDVVPPTSMSAVEGLCLPAP